MTTFFFFYLKLTYTYNYIILEPEFSQFFVHGSMSHCYSNNKYIPDTYKNNDGCSHPHLVIRLIVPVFKVLTLGLDILFKDHTTSKIITQ